VFVEIFFCRLAVIWYNKSYSEFCHE
jgi:hypothetical protein